MLLTAPRGGAGCFHTAGGGGRNGADGYAEPAGTGAGGIERKGYYRARHRGRRRRPWGARQGVLSRQSKLTQTTYHVPRATRLQYISLVMYWSRAFLGPRFHAYRDGGSRGHVRRMGRAKRTGAIAEDVVCASERKCERAWIQPPQRSELRAGANRDWASLQGATTIRATLRSSTALQRYDSTLPPPVPSASGIGTPLTPSGLG